MSLTKSHRNKLIDDYLLGIENPTYEVRPKNDGGWIVRKRRSKSAFSKSALKKIEENEPVIEEEVKKEPKIYDNIPIEEIAETLFNKLTALKEKKKMMKEDKHVSIDHTVLDNEEEDVDQTPIQNVPTELPYNTLLTNYQEPQYQEPMDRPMTSFRRRQIRLY
jgi:DNA-directed RNA polymerase specialized sigma subunit